MQLRRTNDFAQQRADFAIRLAIARDLQRIWSDVLHEALPTELRRIIDKLEQVTDGDQALTLRDPAS